MLARRMRYPGLLRGPATGLNIPRLHRHIDLYFRVKPSEGDIISSQISPPFCHLDRLGLDIPHESLSVVGDCVKQFLCSPSRHHRMQTGYARDTKIIHLLHKVLDAVFRHNSHTFFQGLNR